MLFPQIKLSLQNLRSLRIRRDFFTSLAEQPSQFIQKFVESQSRDLEVVLGNERAAEGGGAGGNASFGSGGDGGIRESDLMKSEFFEGDWVYEAVGVHEGIRMGGAVAAMHHAQHAQVAHIHQQVQQQQHQGGMQGMGHGGMHMQMR
jgi:SWI/SNF-related matrix-associated actin-dependent regulator of chromatin subfamily D